MTGIISGIKRMEIHDGDGLRTTVFFKGCTLKCIWCHNPESIGFDIQTAFFKEKCIGCGLCGGVHSQATAEGCPVNAQVLYGKEYEARELAEILAKDKAFFDNSGGGVTFSGGECLAQHEFAAELAKILKSKGIGVYIDTCGYVKQEAFEKIMPYADKFLYDIKAIDSDVHIKCTGKDNGLILENLKYLSEKNCDIEIRYPLVMGYNDGECERIGAFLSGLNGISKVKVLQYHSFSASRYEALGMESTLPDTETSFENVEKAVELLKGYGLNAVNGITDN